MLGSLSQAANTAIASDVPGNGAPAMRLSNGTLHNLPAHIKKPEYPPAEVKPSIMLIGVSNFSRSLIGKMAQECLNKAYRNGEPLDMGILGVSLKSPDVKNALMPQDCNYTLTSKGVGVNQMEVIGSITKIHCAKENAPEIIEAAADPSITLIALTVTQKGYYTNAEGVNLEDIDIKNCLDPNNPELSTLGLLAHSLHIRMKNGTPPPVIMSCDNMSNNGTVLRNAVMAYAAAHPDIGSETAQWIAEYVPFPTTMVDRITPSWSREHDDYVRSQGISDAYPVLAEPMPKLPLVIEDLSGKEGTIGQVFRDSSINQLVGAGAIISDRVGAYEQMKVRLLNGIHMALGSIGHLMGYKHTDEAMKDPFIRTFAGDYMDQAIFTLPKDSGIDYQAFKKEVFLRLDNPDICDPLPRLARNGVDKLPSRFLETSRDCISTAQNCDNVSFAIASWLHYASQLDPRGYLPSQIASVEAAIAAKKTPEDPNDKKAGKLGLPDLIRNNSHSLGVVFNHEIWERMGQDPRFTAAIETHFNAIREKGMQPALADFIARNCARGYDISGNDPKPTQ